jgi:hypothetical protein
MTEFAAIRGGRIAYDVRGGQRRYRQLTAEVTHDRQPLPGPADHVACQLASDGTVSGGPRAWLRAEAVVLLAGALAAYSTTGQPWWLVPAVILLPDLAWAGYLGGTRVGAFIYNAAHATPLPAVMVGLGWWQHRPLVLALGLVWLAHIGLDHLLDYGLKYDDSFQHTHLGILGRRKEASREPRA